MAAEAEPIATNPLATARQLWRLNREGRLRLVDVGSETAPIPAAVADVAIRQSVEALSTHSQP